MSDLLACKTVRFEKLRPVDLLLAARYYLDSAKNTRSPVRNLVFTALCKNRKAGDWTWEAINRSFERASTDDRLIDHALNDFRVRAIQPRAAELAFWHVHTSQFPNRTLTDLNIEWFKAQRSWSLGALDSKLPAADYESGDVKFDVKSNLYYKQSGIGLRGFYVHPLKERRDSGTKIPGFVFFESGLTHCRCAFVGYMDPQRAWWQGTYWPEQKTRISVFCFESPFRHRSDLTAAHKLETLQALHPLIPVLLGLTDGRSVPKLYRPTAHCLSSVINAARVSWGAVPPEDTLLWLSATDAVFRYRSQGKTESEVSEVLNQILGLCKLQTMPVHLARIPQWDAWPITLLEFWIRECLSKLNAAWSQISCPACGEPGVAVEHALDQLSPSGTFIAHLQCGKCGTTTSNATILTHCGRLTCGDTLVAGNQPWCKNRPHLVCEAVRWDGNGICGYCPCRRDESSGHKFTS